MTAKILYPVCFADVQVEALTSVSNKSRARLERVEEQQTSIIAALQRQEALLEQLLRTQVSVNREQAGSQPIAPPSELFCAHLFGQVSEYLNARTK